MQFERPQNMGHLAQILRQLAHEIRRTQQGIQSGAGIGTAELIRGAHEYAENEAHEARGVDTLAEVQQLAESLGVAHHHVTELIAQTRIAVQKMSEADARHAAKVADGNKYRV